MPNFTYTVSGGGAGFAQEVARVLGDMRGWRQYGYEFRQLEPGAAGADFRIRLEPAAAAATLCGLKGLSCWRPDHRDIIINETNWRTGAASGLSPERYHNYVICHEVGHALGLAHRPCPAAGGPASVMQQMTKGAAAIAPCTPNDWPVPLVDVLPGRKYVLPASETLPAARAAARGGLAKALASMSAIGFAIAVVLVLVLVLVLALAQAPTTMDTKNSAEPIIRHRRLPERP
jgi:hypothetical protein